jgi:hypothetical protein
LYSVPQEEVVAGRFNGNVYKRRKGINNATTTLDISKRLLINLSVKKVGDVVTKQNLFEDAHQLMEF